MYLMLVNQWLVSSPGVADRHPFPDPAFHFDAVPEPPLNFEADQAPH
jgi:hypothetical protein